MRFSISTLAVALACMAVPTLARAHAGNNDPNVVHACVDSDGDVRIVAVDGRCISSPRRKAETPVHWAIKGPQGVPGIPGTPGANGATGAQGPQGVPGRDGKDAARAAGPCFDNINRYVNCGNGTVTDTVTGLIWLQQANCFPPTSYAEANAAAAGLKEGDCLLADGSSPGDWRLPTKTEWQATMARAVTLQCHAPSLTDDDGRGCFNTGGGSSFRDVVAQGGLTFWSSSSDESDAIRAVIADTSFGIVAANFFLLKSGTPPLRVWPVRGGAR